MFPNKRQQKQSRRLHRFAMEIRGKFLNASGWIEPTLTEIVTHYFGVQEAKRRSLLCDEVLSRMRFASKVTLLGKILENEGRPDARLIERLGKFRSFRNHVVHSYIDTSQATLDAMRRNEVTFIYHEGGKVRRLRVTGKEAQEKAKDANELRALLAIQKTLGAVPVVVGAR
jgi:hypothetical protein